MVKRVILITGASSGIGLEYAKYFSQKNYFVAVCARSKNILKKNFQNCENVFYQKVDLKKESEIKKFVKSVIRKYKRIDILINNAGIAKQQKIQNLDYDYLSSAFKVNIISYFLFIKECLPIMKKNKFGRIVNISSGGSVNCVSNYSVYSATKAAVNTLAKSFSNEIDPRYNIKVNSISPGPCKTKMFPNNPLSPLKSISTLEKVISDNLKVPTGEFYFFMKKKNVIPNIKFVLKK